MQIRRVEYNRPKQFNISRIIKTLFLVLSFRRTGSPSTQETKTTIFLHLVIQLHASLYVYAAGTIRTFLSITTHAILCCEGAYPLNVKPTCGALVSIPCTGVATCAHNCCCFPYLSCFCLFCLASSSPPLPSNPSPHNLFSFVFNFIRTNRPAIPKWLGRGVSHGASQLQAV